jgi:hypothetical protein
MPLRQLQYLIIADKGQCILIPWQYTGATSRVSSPLSVFTISVPLRMPNDLPLVAI